MIQDFPGKQHNETVLMVIRKHSIVYARIFVAFLMVSFVPIIIFIVIWERSFPLSEGGIVTVIGYLGVTFYLLYGMAILLIAILNEEFDLFILTDHRLIDITQVSFLKRTVATTPLNQIQDTTSDINGILATIFNYGSIDVQTAAGAASSFTIDHVPDPAVVARKILIFADKSKGENYMESDIGDEV